MSHFLSTAKALIYLDKSFKNYQKNPPCNLSHRKEGQPHLNTSSIGKEKTDCLWALRWVTFWNFNYSGAPTVYSIDLVFSLVERRDVMNGGHTTFCLIHQMNGHRYSWHPKRPRWSFWPDFLGQFSFLIWEFWPSCFSTNCIILSPFCSRLSSQQKLAKSQAVGIESLN